MDSSVDMTRNHLRKRLDQLGYRLHFGMDSVPLVAKLFSDLVHTTVSLRDAKLSAGKPERHRHADVSPEPPYMTVLPRQLDSGDHFLSTVSGRKKIGIALFHHSTQTDDEGPPPPPYADEDSYRRLVALQEELVTLKSELDISHERTKAVTGQLAEAQEAKRSLERTLERTLEELRRARSDEAAELASRNEDGAVAQMVAVKERVLSMAYRKLSASKEVILGQQEVIQNLEEILCQKKAEVCEQSHLREQLAEARGRNDKLEGLVAFLEAEKSALQDKVDKMMANDRDLVLGLDLPQATIGSGGGPRRCLADVITSLEEERDRYRREAQRYKSLLGATAPTADTTNSPTQARRSKFVLAATFQGNVA